MSILPPLLDTSPFDLSRDDAQELRDLLVASFRGSKARQELWEEAGLPLDDIEEGGNARQQWNEALKVAAKHGKLRSLVDAARKRAPSLEDELVPFERRAAWRNPSASRVDMDALFELAVKIGPETVRAAFSDVCRSWLVAPPFVDRAPGVGDHEDQVYAVFDALYERAHAAPAVGDRTGFEAALVALFGRALGPRDPRRDQVEAVLGELTKNPLEQDLEDVVVRVEEDGEAFRVSLRLSQGSLESGPGEAVSKARVFDAVRRRLLEFLERVEDEGLDGFPGRTEPQRLVLFIVPKSLLMGAFDALDFSEEADENWHVLDAGRVVVLADEPLAKVHDRKWACVGTARATAVWLDDRVAAAPGGVRGWHRGARESKAVAAMLFSSDRDLHERLLLEKRYLRAFPYVVVSRCSSCTRQTVEAALPELTRLRRDVHAGRCATPPWREVTFIDNDPALRARVAPAIARMPAVRPGDPDAG